MSTKLTFPWICLSILGPAIVAAFAWSTHSVDKIRKWAIGALLVCELSLLAALYEVSHIQTGQLVEPLPNNWLAGWFAIDSLNAIPMPLFAALALGLVILVPKRKLTQRWISGVLVLTSATLATYAANNIFILVIAFAFTTAPFLVNSFFAVRGERQIPPLAKVSLASSVLFLAAGALLIVFGSQANGWHQTLSFERSYIDDKSILYSAFWLIMAALFLRKGLLPVHSWILASYDRGPLLPLTLLTNSHLGIFVAARLVIPIFPELAQQIFPWLGNLGLLTAAYTTILALKERQPRRLLAILSLSQSSFIFVGLASYQTEGIVGSLVHWQVVAVAMTILASVLTCLEGRVGSPIDGSRFLGLAANAPRLAVFFAIGGLALVGLPLTLGFCAQELLIHGTLTSYPSLGIVMPIVTTLNAFHAIRLFAVMFLGPASSESHGLADALPRERWVLTIALLFLIVGGLLPAQLVRLPLMAANRIETLLISNNQILTNH